MISRLVLGLLDDVDVERRRLYAARLFVLSIVGWAVSHVLLVVTNRTSFFEHCLMAISWCAISLTAVDVVITSDVREQQSEDSS